jgi:hypothetical protein
MCCCCCPSLPPACHIAANSVPVRFGSRLSTGTPAPKEALPLSTPLRAVLCCWYHQSQISPSPSPAGPIDTGAVHTPFSPNNRVGASWCERCSCVCRRLDIDRPVAASLPRRLSPTTRLILLPSRPPSPIESSQRPWSPIETPKTSSTSTSACSARLHHPSSRQSLLLSAILSIIPVRSSCCRLLVSSDSKLAFLHCNSTAFSIFRGLPVSEIYDQPGPRSAAVTAKTQRIASSRCLLPAHREPADHSRRNLQQSPNIANHSFILPLYTSTTAIHTLLHARNDL